MLKQFQPNSRSLWLLFVPPVLVVGLLLAQSVPAVTPQPNASPSIFAPAASNSAKKEAAPAKPAVIRPKTLPEQNATPKNYVMRLDVSVQPGQDLEEAYFQYFSKNQVHPKVIRAKVRRIANDASNDDRFSEAVAIIRSAIRSGQVQPWMYEALGLMMEAARMPRDEIERTIMSAADFAKTPQELIYLADYLDRMKFRVRALELLKLVSDKVPSMTDPYIRGLRLAKQIKNDASIQWAALGILRQEWPQGQREIRKQARFAALSLLSRMRKRGDDKTADAFAAQLKDALARDVVVRIAWAGDADVDLMIEEPGGTVCSYRNPRTAGGGVLVGDLNTKIERSSGSGYSETYVCPEAFDGEYRILLRQVWGRIPAGKVTVDVWTHGGTAKTVHYHKTVSVDEEKPALVRFKLDNGRRKDSLDEHLLANDIASQVAANRALLAQQINALAKNAQIEGQQIGNQQQQPFLVSQTPTLDPDGRLAGFRPDIIVLPTGATMSVNAVISADRRYVRITALPFFSGVAAVTQFNLQQGVTGIDNDLGNVDIDIGANDADRDIGVDAG